MNLTPRNDPPAKVALNLRSFMRGGSRVDDDIDCNLATWVQLWRDGRITFFQDTDGALVRSTDEDGGMGPYVLAADGSERAGAYPTHASEMPPGSHYAIAFVVDSGTDNAVGYVDRNVPEKVKESLGHAKWLTRDDEGLHLEVDLEDHIAAVQSPAKRAMNLSVERAEAAIAKAIAEQKEKLCDEAMERAGKCESYEELVDLFGHLPRPGTALDVSATIGDELWVRAVDLAVGALPKPLADIVNDVGNRGAPTTGHWVYAKHYSALEFVQSMPPIKGQAVLDGLELIGGGGSGDRARSMDAVIETHRDAVEAVTMFLKNGRPYNLPRGDPLLERCKKRLRGDALPNETKPGRKACRFGR